mmetsp:Transcript_12423/g.44685  ORF Transcript_12423/g.44685 Transcript_12423/m.44685 type:complete len:208 (+) Transcript_12423:730-1353(+)
MAAPRFSPMPLRPPTRPHGLAAGSLPSSTLLSETSNPSRTTAAPGFPAPGFRLISIAPPPPITPGGVIAVIPPSPSSSSSSSSPSSSSTSALTVNAHPPSPSITLAPGVSAYCNPGDICLPPTKVPAALPKSSTYTPPPTRSTDACALSTPLTPVRMRFASPLRRPVPMTTGTPGSRSTAGPGQPTGAKTTRASDANEPSLRSTISG